jgi:predicted O-linked N-acetylglucosamine transferase (SPINDLY family)
MDYFISSDNYELAGAQQHYSERLITLPDAGTLSYYYRPARPATPRSKESFGFGPTDRIYLCPQTLFKVHPAMDELFLGILEADPDARIVLIEPAATHLRKALECRLQPVLGELAGRVVYLKSLPYEEYLSLIQCADVMLDTLHFNGQNTSLEALSLNIPVVTLPGTMQRERHTYGMYAAMRFTELVAGTKEDYVQLAVRVVNDTAFRNHCQSRIAESASVLFENANFVRNCEAAFCEMIRELNVDAPRTSIR